MKKILLPTLLFFSLITHHSFGVQQVWVNHYSLLPNKTNQATAMALVADGIVVSGSSANTNGDLDYLIIKYGFGGNQSWLTRYDSTTNGNDLVRGMAVDKAGNATLTGTLKTAKFGTNGNFVWSAPYGGRAVATGTNGDVYVTGFSEVDFSTAKLNAATGTNLWTTTYDAIGTTDVSQVICVDSAENVFVSGFETWRCDTLGCYRRFKTFKYDANGVESWRAIMSYSPVTKQRCDALTIIPGQSGNVYLCGNHDDSYPFNYNTAQFDSGGNEIWEWWLDLDGEGDYYADCRSMIQDGAGSIYLTGSRVAGNICCTVKLNTNGHKAWLAEYHGPAGGQNFGTGITLDSATNVYVTGYSPGVGTGTDIITIKYDNNGNQLWLQRYDGPAHGDDIATGLVVDTNGNIYVTGYSATTNGGTEFVTIKYSQKPALNIEKQPDGSMRLKLFSDPGQLWGFQTTTNFLTDWQTIGTNTTNTNGVAQFDDTNTPPFPPRFYRGVSPPLP